MSRVSKLKKAVTIANIVEAEQILKDEILHDNLNPEAQELSCWDTKIEGVSRMVPPTGRGDLAMIAMRQGVIAALKIPVIAAQVAVLHPKALEPWEQCPDVWKTKAAFFQWMRGQMRRAWARHPVKVSYMHNHRKRVPLGRITTKNPKGLVWGCQCEHCHQEFKQTECEVDHIEAAGSFKGWEDFEAWMVKLMHINWNSIRIVCKECHRIISYAERMHITFEEAKLEKEVIAFTKLPCAKQISILMLALKDNKIAGNAKTRRAAYKQYLQEKL